ncbi:MAG TPA: hypothetical protein VFL42_03930, partial [Terriglobales bacterium]|nr:hypothetical protein [Terriglobales bacterium]
MSRKQLLIRLLLKAAWVRKDRALTALISVAVAATIATAALTVYYDLDNKLSREFRSFGANVVVTRSQGSLTQNELATMGQILNGKGDIVPVAYAIGTLQDGTRVVVGGTDLEKLEKLNSWWSIDHSEFPFALLGARVAEKVPESAFIFNLGHKGAMIRRRDVFRSGSDDDSRIYLQLSQFTDATGLEPNTALLRIEGWPKQIEVTISQLTTSLPELEVKPVRQITREQTSVVDKTRSVVLVASVVVLVMILLSIV